MANKLYKFLTLISHMVGQRQRGQQCSDLWANIWGPFYWDGLTLISAWISNHSVGWNYLFIRKLQRLFCWILEMDEQYHPTHYNGCDYFSMLGLHSIHDSKIGSRNSVYMAIRRSTNSGCSASLLIIIFLKFFQGLTISLKIVPCNLPVEHVFKQKMVYLIRH